MSNPVGYVFYTVAARLSMLGVIDRRRGVRIAELTWPRFLTMFARNLNRVADVAMVGLSIGPAAIAGLALANVYWGLANGFSLGVAGGTISMVSQRFGADEIGQLDLTVKQSVWFGVAIALPFVLVYWFFAESLVGLLGNDAATVGLGAAYLRVLSVALLFNILNLVASRTLAGADDTWIAMFLRATGAFVNIVLNAFFIFGLGLGVRGAAMGTVLAEGLITACFLWGFVTGSLPVVGAFPVRLSLRGPYFDTQISKQLLSITPPLMVQKQAHSIAQFPLFAILVVYGPTVVAAFEVARRTRSLMRSTGSGFAMSASSLVGQELGRGDEAEAALYANDIIRFSAVIYLLTVVFVIAFARPIAHLFVDDPTAISRTIPFIRVAAVSFVGLGLNSTFRGIIRAAGDNTWSMYGRIVSQYVALIPLVYLGTISALGVTAVFVAMIAEGWSTAAVTGYRAASGKWMIVSRAHRPNVGDD